MDRAEAISITEEIQSIEGQNDAEAIRYLLGERLIKISEGNDDELRSLLDSLLEEQKITQHTRKWLEDLLSLK